MSEDSSSAAATSTTAVDLDKSVSEAVKLITNASRVVVFSGAGEFSPPEISIPHYV